MIIWSLCGAFGEAASPAEALGWQYIPGVRRLGPISVLALMTVLVTLFLLWLNIYWEQLKGGRASFLWLKRFQSTVLLSTDSEPGIRQVIMMAGSCGRGSSLPHAWWEAEKREGWAQDTLRVHPLAPIS